MSSHPWLLQKYSCTCIHIHQVVLSSYASFYRRFFERLKDERLRKEIILKITHQYYHRNVTRAGLDQNHLQHDIASFVIERK